MTAKHVFDTWDSTCRQVDFLIFIIMLHIFWVRTQVQVIDSYNKTTTEAHLLSTCGTVVNGIELGEKMMNSRQRLASISASISESRLSRGFRENHLGQWYCRCSLQQGPGLYLFASAQLPADILFSPGLECGLPWESLSFSVLLSHSDEIHHKSILIKNALVCNQCNQPLQCYDDKTAFTWIRLPAYSCIFSNPFQTSIALYMLLCMSP